MRRRLALIAVTAMVMIAGACGGDDDDDVDAAGAGSEPATEISDTAPEPNDAESTRPSVDDEDAYSASGPDEKPAGTSQSGTVGAEPDSATQASAATSTTARSGTEPTRESGAVSVTAGAGHVEESGSIEATVRNGLSRSVFAEDMKAGCSIVHLERLDEATSEVGTWERVDRCNAERAPQVVEIKGGTQQSVSISVQAGGLESGSYRIAFGHRFSPTPEGDESEVVYSETFTVG